MLKKLNILLVLISAPCLLVAMQAVDQFKGLDEKRYDAPIIRSLCGRGNEKIVEDLFRELQPDDRARHMHTLFAMVTAEGMRIRLTKPVDDFCRVAIRLLNVADAFEMFADSHMREAFFAFSYAEADPGSMFGKALEDSCFPMERIKVWFPQDEPAENKQRMLTFLNNYRRDRVGGNEAKRITEMCAHIGFDEWDKVSPRARYAFNGTIQEKDTQKIKEFLSTHGINFNEMVDDQGIESFRERSFSLLILKHISCSNVEALLSIANFLGDNRHIFRVNQSLETCFLGINKILKKQGKTFELELKLFCSYVLSLRFNIEELGYGMFETDRYVKQLMRVSLILPDEQFAQACKMLIEDEDYSLFLKRSGYALEAYIKAHPYDPKQVRKTIAQAKGNQVNIEEAVSCKLGRRAIVRARIHRLLNVDAPDLKTTSSKYSLADFGRLALQITRTQDEALLLFSAALPRRVSGPACSSDEGLLEGCDELPCVERPAVSHESSKSFSPKHPSNKRDRVERERELRSIDREGLATLDLLLTKLAEPRSGPASSSGRQ